MIPVQRIFALLMSAVLVFVLLVPLALKRHNYGIVIVIVALFVVYLAVNAWIWKRMRS